MKDTLCAVKLKIGKNVMVLDENDVVMDNGSCIQIITRMKHPGWHSYPVTMSKKLFKELIKNGGLFTNEIIQAQNQREFCGKIIPCTYYKFNINQMIKLGYEVFTEDNNERAK